VTGKLDSHSRPEGAIQKKSRFLAQIFDCKLTGFFRAGFANAGSKPQQLGSLLGGGRFADDRPKENAAF